LPPIVPLSSFPGEREERMYRIWHWATIDREYDGRFIASITDLWNLAAYGAMDKEAVAHVTAWRANVCGLP
jgi:hypothetical protein